MRIQDLIRFPDDFRYERRAAEAFLQNLWPALLVGWRSLDCDDVAELRKWEECGRVRPYWQTIAGLRMAVEQVSRLGEDEPDYANLKATLAGQTKDVNPHFVWISMRALLGAEIARRVEMPFAAWDENLGDDGGFTATLVLEVLSGAGAGVAAQHPESALRGQVKDGFRDSITAAWQAACELLSASGERAPRDCRWRIEGTQATIKGGSASGAAALGWHHALCGTVPDPGIIVVAEVRPGGDLCAVDAGGLGAKLRAVRTDGRWDTVAVATGQKVNNEFIERVPNLQALIELRSKLTYGAIQWLRGLANALDETEWAYKGKRILVSETAVDAFVYTKRRLEDDLNSRKRRAERPESEVLPFEEPNAHLYEEPLDRAGREKKRWRQVIQSPRLRLGVRGAPGGGKTFLTLNSALALARESAERIERREISLNDAPVPFWLTAKGLAAASCSDIAETVVNASQRSLEKTRHVVPPPPREWLLKAATSSDALVVVDALDELVDTEVEGFERGSRQLDALPGKLIATCRTTHWDKCAPWLGWPQILDVELAPFEARERREFARRFPSESNSGGVSQLLAANYPLLHACRCPLLLAFVCLLHAEGKNLLGSNRVTLYSTIVRELLSGRWRNLTPPPWCGNQELEEKILGFLAGASLKIFTEAPGANRFTHAQWVRAGEPPVPGLLSILVQCGVLKLAGTDDLGYGLWSFVHRTLLEFLAARALSCEAGAVWLGEAKKHFWFEPEWIEVLTFLAAHVGDATPLIRAVEEEREDIFYSMLYLRSRLAAAARRVDPAVESRLSGEIEEFCRVFKKPALSLLHVVGGTSLGNRVGEQFLRLLGDGYCCSAADSQIAAEALGHLGDTRALRPLLEMIWQEDLSPFAHKPCDPVEALKQLGDVRAVEPLLGMLQSRNEDVQYRGASALGRLGDVCAVEPLLGMLQDSCPHVRQASASALGELGDVRAVEPLLAMLQDSCRHVRQASASALGELGDVRAVEPLVRLLLDNDPFVRRSATRALGRLGDRRAVEPLLGLLRDIDRRPSQNLPVRKGDVMWSLVALGDTRAVEPLLETLHDLEYQSEFGHGAGFEELGDRRAVEPLLGLLQNDNAGVRSGAARALGTLGDKRAVDPLLRALRDLEGSVRSMASLALGRLGDKRAVDALLGLLRDKDTAGVAAEALGRLGDVRAVEPLLGMLRNEDTARTVVGALGRLGDRRAIEPLLGTYQDQDLSVFIRDDAFAALKKLTTRYRIHIPLHPQTS